MIVSWALHFPASLTHATSWLSMLGGVLMLFGVFLQQFIPVLNSKAAKFFKENPQAWLKRKLNRNDENYVPVDIPQQTFKGSLIGLFVTFIPLFGFMQGLFIAYREATEPEVYGESASSYWVAGIAGIVIGFASTIYFQYQRWNAHLGVLTLNQGLMVMLAWFMANHSDPFTSVLAIAGQIALLGAYGCFSKYVEREDERARNQRDNL